MVLFLRSFPVKFHKQRVIGPYIVDFCCPSAKLIVELDGSQHFMSEGQCKDAERDARLAEQGYAILRFPNVEIEGHFPEVCETIQRQTQRRMNPSQSPRHTLTNPAKSGKIDRRAS